MHSIGNQVTDELPFEPRLGRMRGRGSRRGRKYLHQVLAAAARAGFPRRAGGRRFTGSRIGRGGVAARMLGGGHAGARSRRAIVKTRLVRLGGKGLAAARAHLRYIQRDGVTREGEPGRLYSDDEDGADGRAFFERCAGDRHQFRFIVSAEDGDQYEDLRPLVRRFMARMEEDLGTKLDWVAADHVDTLHPHTHIMLRGRDEHGTNLVIAPDYIRHGMRERLAGLVALDLGPPSALEIGQRLRREVQAERLTILDRRLLREAGASRSSTVQASGRTMADHALRTGRLRKLGALGLATDLGHGRWRLAVDLEPTLRRLGEEGDIVRTMQRALTAAGVERGVAEQVVRSPGAGASVTGKIVVRGLADELDDRHFLIVDGLDGRAHYVDIGKGASVEPIPEGAIVRATPRMGAAGETDRRIAAVAAANGGRYSIELHQAAEGGASSAFAQSHVRRLEAIRRSVGGVDRAEDGSWTIPADFLDQTRRHEILRARAAPVAIEILSPLPLEQLADHDGATWLDRELAAPVDVPRDSGFGREVRSALAIRRAWLVEQGLAAMDGEQLVIRPDAVARLERHDVQRAAAALSRESGLRFVEAEPGMQVEGLVRRRVDLASGRFAMIESGREFALVPWRPVLARAIGRPVAGRVRLNGDVSWTFGRGRGIEV